jgi:NADPH:quinone reductase-like Zn-dependent oxidoreductase
LLRSAGTLEQSIKSTALNDQVNFIGRLSDAASKIDINLLYNSVATLRVIFAGNRAQFIAMNRAIAVNRLKSIIDRVFPFEQVVEAFRFSKTPSPLERSSSVTSDHQPIQKPEPTPEAI